MLIVLGALAMAMAARPLARHDALDFPVNPLGIHRSPYGEVLAMAMQEPVDTLWNQGQVARLARQVVDSRNSPEEHAPAPDPPADAPLCTPTGESPWNQRFRAFLESLDEASTARTNAVPSSPAHDRHIRRQVENKLRFAYRLDPAHYGNYNSYHFFLTEPQMGTRRILTPAAAELARETIEYGLAETHDPRPALTAAAAATNILHLMFADQRSENPHFTPAQMRETLDLLDHCIARHLAIHAEWTAAGHDHLLSPMRILEMEERLSFVRRIRDAAEPAVERFEREMAAQNSK